MARPIKIPLYKPRIGAREKELVNDCLDSTWISSRGKYVEEFENLFAKTINTKNAISCCNGTVALHLATLACDIKEGDEVLVTSLTYISSVNCVRYVGAKPIFVDVNPLTWQIDENDIEKKINSRTKAVIVVHLYGYASNMVKIKNICRKYNLYLIEDCAEALGTKYQESLVGSFGDIGTFSFFGNKTLTTGEGGMVVTNNDELADKMYI